MVLVEYYMKAAKPEAILEETRTFFLKISDINEMQIKKIYITKLHTLIFGINGKLNMFFFFCLGSNYYEKTYFFLNHFDVLADRGFS